MAELCQHGVVFPEIAAETHEGHEFLRQFCPNRFSVVLGTVIHRDNFEWRGNEDFLDLVDERTDHATPRRELREITREQRSRKNCTGCPSEKCARLRHSAELPSRHPATHIIRTPATMNSGFNTTVSPNNSPIRKLRRL